MVDPSLFTEKQHLNLLKEYNEKLFYQFQRHLWYLQTKAPLGRWKGHTHCWNFDKINLKDIKVFPFYFFSFLFISSHFFLFLFCSAKHQINTKRNK